MLLDFIQVWIQGKKQFILRKGKEIKCGFQKAVADILYFPEHTDHYFLPHMYQGLLTLNGG